MNDLVDVKLIDGTARSVRVLFSGRKYGLDYYQREFTWSESNIAELLDDLATSFLQDYSQGDERSAVASYRPYFLGPIVTSSKGGSRFLVDGQQRLTSLSLLLVHLKHLSTGLQGAEDLAPLVYSQQYGKLSFNIDVKERDSVMHAILGDTNFDPNGASESVKNIWARYQDIVELFPDELKGDALLHFTDWLLERVVLVEIATTDPDMALEIFETMNDRGMRLSNTDMLKGFLLARIKSPKDIEHANDLWRQRVQELTELDKNADSDLMKHWLRGKFAASIRERKKDATPKDFDLIGTAFHKWVRDNQQRMGLATSHDFEAFVMYDFAKMSRRYMKLLVASQKLEAGWEHVFYNATTGLTLQYLPILAAVRPDDDEETFRSKTRLVASYLDMFVARRMVNFRNFGYSTISYTIFNLAKDVRNADLDTLRDVLADRVASLPETFDGVSTFRLTQRNRSHIRYLLARMTAWLEQQSGKPNIFDHYVDRAAKKPFEVEHIWADKYDRHASEFSSPHEFAEHRDRFGDLVLLPKDFNASYGDKPYESKLPHYFKQNVLAASLNPNFYEHNPSFLKVVGTYDLPLAPFPDGFTRSDIDTRQELYRQICELVWSPEALGLDGGTPASETTEKQRKAFYNVVVRDLISADLLNAGEKLYGTRSGKHHEATVLADGRVQATSGEEFETLSGASDSLTGMSTNGWDFWHVERPNGPRALVELRRELLEAKGFAGEANPKD